MQDNEYVDIDPSSETAQETVQMDFIYQRENHNQPLAPGDSEDKRYLNWAEDQAIREQELIRRPRQEQENKRESNKKGRICLYGLITICFILLFFLGVFYIIIIM